MRRSFIALAGVMLVMLVPTAALAQTPSPTPPDDPYPPNRPTCLADRSQASPGSTVDITGDAWETDSPVDLDFHQSNPAVDHDLGGAQANSAGTFVVTVRVPTDAHRGAATIVLTGTDQAGDPASCTVSLTIVAGPPADACAQVSDDVVVPGQDIVVFSARGCWEAGSTNKLFFHSTPVFLGSARVKADGSFSVTVTIPAGAAAGDHTITVEGTDASGAPDVVTIPVEVVAGGGGDDGLSGTGIAVFALLALALGLLGAGSSLLVAARAVPAGDDHPALRQERQRRFQRARLVLSAGALATTGWLAAAAVHPGYPGGLSLGHPLSVVTLALAVGAGWAAWAAIRSRQD